MSVLDVERRRAAKRAYHHRNREANLARNRAWYATNREYARIKHALNGRALKREIITKYGGHCYCCGEANVAFLSIDHINGDGHVERRTSGRSGKSFYQVLKKAPPRPDLRVACMNCNHATGTSGVCPHVAEYQALTSCSTSSQSLIS